MINGQYDMDHILADLLRGAIPHPYDAQNSIPVFFGVPEEDVVQSSFVPGLRVAYQHDYSLENRQRVRHQPRLYRWVDEEDHDKGLQRIRPPLFRRLVYELDLLTHKYLDMIELSQRVTALLSREYDSLTDDDGNDIVYRLDGMTDMAREVGEERIFRRLFVYSFDAWVLEAIVDIGPPVKFIHQANIHIIKKPDGPLMESFWVPHDPTEQEDP